MRRAGAASGFTLLEVMIAVAILAATLVVLLRIVTNNIRATNHAKMTTAATFLARTKMSDVEDDVLYNGFSRISPLHRAHRFEQRLVQVEPAAFVGTRLTLQATAFRTVLWLQCFAGHMFAP